MKTRSERALYVIGLALALLVCAGSSAHAQQSLDLPAPSNQGQPPVNYRPRPTPQPYLPQSNDVQTIPQAPQNITPPPPPVREAAPILPLPPPPPETTPPPTVRPPAYQNEPVLPAVFRGCWQGRVNYLDSQTRVPGSPPASWTPKTYRLCYQRIGNGPFQLTFSDAGIARDSRIGNAQGRMRLLTTDGRTYATMRAFLHFDEYFRGGSFPVDEATNLQCQIEPDGMHVAGQVAGTHDGDPWFRARWHTVLMHVAQAPIRGGIPE